MIDAYIQGAVDAARRELDGCDVCEPPPADLADTHVSPEAIRAAVEAEREECAELCERCAREFERSLIPGALIRATECWDLARLIRARGRVTV
jgi:hypothetical protein